MIARVGAGGEVQDIGVSRELKVAKGGRLVLGINDKDPENNEGSLEVTVHVARGTEQATREEK